MNENSVERLPLSVIKTRETLHKAKQRAKSRIWREPFLASLVGDAATLAESVSVLAETLQEYKVVFSRSVVKDGGPELLRILTNEGTTAVLRRLNEIECAVRDFRFRVLGESEARQ